MQVIKPLSELDNGALLEVMLDAITQLYALADSSVDTQLAVSAIDAASTLESRKSFQSIQSMKE